MKGRAWMAAGSSLTLALALAMAACGGTPAKPAQPAAKATAQAKAAPAKPAAAAKPLVKVSVMMAFVPTGWDAGFWVAQAKGFYKQQGLDVTPEPGKATFQTAEAVANGRITFGQLDGGALIAALGHGLPLIGVAELVKQQPFAVLVPASSSIKTISDLKGKHVGDNPANATAQLLPGVLAAHHMTESQIHMVQMNNRTLPLALLQHKVDAIAGLTIGQGAVVEFKGMPLRFLSYSASGIDQPGFGIVTSTSYAKAHPGIVRRFILGTRMGMQWTARHPAAAVAILQKGSEHTNAKLLLKQLQLSLPLWSNPPGGPYDLQQYRTAEAELLKFGVIKKSLPVARIVTNQYVPK